VKETTKKDRANTDLACLS